MKNYYLVPQPPTTEKYTFLVDELAENKSMGITSDIEKILYNIHLMGKDFNQDLEIGLNVSIDGIMDVIDLGKYIAVVGLKKDRSEGSIYFFHSNTDFTRQELINQMKSQFNEIISKKFIDIYDLMVLESSLISDNVSLLIPLDS